jgi:hypothetical protein
MPDMPEPEAQLPDGAGEEVRRIVEEQYAQHINDVLGEVPRPINWRTLPPEDLEHELLELNAWVDWLRHEYGFPAQIIPPMWHRHPELRWELSALRQHWLFSYDPQAKGNQALAWHHDFGHRPRTAPRLGHHLRHPARPRPTHPRYPWPGGEAEDWAEPDTTERSVTARTEDFLAFAAEQVAARLDQRDAVIRELADEDRVICSFACPSNREARVSPAARSTSVAVVRR